MAGPDPDDSSGEGCLGVLFAAGLCLGAQGLLVSNGIVIPPVLAVLGVLILLGFSDRQDSGKNDGK